ncbi:MAG: GrpB family protein [Actinomycetota bacterium]|nr:GrpB family protein [Actinomycetota bacterium]
MGVVEIHPHDEGWPARFREVAARLRSALGDLATRIDHIGSTSVEGLDAKDVIDVQISVIDDSGLELAAATLESEGWARSPRIDRDHRPAGSTSADPEWRKKLLTEPPGFRRVNAHVRIDGRANQRYALLFRDYLRTHPDSAQAYARLKKDLAMLLPHDAGRYADTKDAACDLIYLAAEEWAPVTGWNAGRSDA